MSVEPYSAQLADARDPQVAAALRDRFQRSARAAVAPIPVAVPLLFLVVRNATDTTRLSVWCGLAILCGLIQWLLYLRLPAERDWTNQAVMCQALAGSVWGGLPWLIMPETQVWQALIGALLLSVLAASALFVAPIRAAYLGFLTPAALLGAASFAFLADGDARLMAILIPVATSFYLYLAEVSHRGAVESVTLTLALELQASTDTLTGLANRAAFLRYLDSSLNQAVQHGHDVAVAFLDLDDFKDINDTHGHAAGDQMLVVIGRRLAAAMQGTGLVARIGGDEFTVVTRSVDAIDIDLKAVGQRLLSVFDEPVVFENSTFQLSSSVGIARAIIGMSPAELLGHADRAQYRAKRSGGRALEVDG